MLKKGFAALIRAGEHQAFPKRSKGAMHCLRPSPDTEGFNSTLVLLKVLDIWLVSLCVSLFQFHTGSIKGRRMSATNSRKW